MKSLLLVVCTVLVTLAIASAVVLTTPFVPKGRTRATLFSVTGTVSPCAARDRALLEFRDADGAYWVVTWIEATGALAVVSEDGNCTAPTTTTTTTATTTTATTTTAAPTTTTTTTTSTTTTT